MLPLEKLLTLYRHNDYNNSGLILYINESRSLLIYLKYSNSDGDIVKDKLLPIRRIALDKSKWLVDKIYVVDSPSYLNYTFFARFLT